jgi:hypothetical protein
MLLSVLCLVPGLCAQPWLLAQVDEDYTGDTAARPNIPSRAAMPGAGSGEVQLNVRSFGLGNVARPGEWIGINVEVSDSSDKVRTVIVRIAVPDLDGDTALMQRVIVTNPGAIQRVWLYFRLPFGLSAGTDFNLSASEAVASGAGEGEAQQYSPGRLLGTLRYTVNPNSDVPMGLGLLPIIGNHGAGLEQYAWVPDSPNVVYPKHSLTSHEFTRVVTGIPLNAIPDRWQGYCGITALAWTSAASEDSPLNIGKFQADAIREYVRRGGHFIVVLPNVGQNWIGQPNNPLADIMPAARVTRTEGVSLDKYRTLITSDPDVTYPTDSVVQTFAPESGTAWPADTLPIMVGPDAEGFGSEAVVVRRVVGAGMVTVVGLDLASIKLQSRTHAFMAERFWNRVLGKRMRIPTPAEIAAGRKGTPGFTGAKDAENFDYRTQLAEIDRPVAAAVNNEGTAALGLLLAFIVFASYWLIAGPVGYFVLKQRNWKRHAWVGFMAATAVFTAISWGGANIMRGRRVTGHHLTIVDGVYGQPIQRARSWLGLFLPKYGEQEVSLAPSTGTGAEWHNLIATWENPTAASAGWSSFPDAAPYIVDCRSPDTIRFPVRATTKQVQMDWAGALPEGWGMPHPIADPSVPVGKEIRVLDKKGAKRRQSMDGQITHNLPAPLKDVWVVFILGPSSRANVMGPYDLPLDAYYAKVNFANGDWKPNDPLALDVVFQDSSPAVGLLDSLVPHGSNYINYGQTDYPPAQLSRAISFMDLAQPPEPMKTNTDVGRTVLYRNCTHGLDLSRWFSQPCIIVIGELGTNDNDAQAQVECPLPIRVDNLAPNDVRKRLTGRTIVRWIYPLDAAPFKAGGAAAPTTDPDDLDKLIDKQSPPSPNG